MSTKCSFLLNSPNGVYYSGGVVSGTITLITTKDKNVRNVRIIFLGEGKVKWSESQTTTNSDGTSSTHTTYYKSHVVYVRSETVVHGEGVLAKGQHTYTFRINLPPECPTSCEGKFGHIRYVISLKVDRPYRFDNVFQRPLTVLQTIDLNLNPIYKIPLVAEEIGYLSCCTCSNGKLFYTFSTPFGAYAPGQTIQYSLHIQNQSMTDSVGFILTFSQKQTFIANSPRRKERCSKHILIEKRHSECCLRLSTRIFKGQLRIPSVPSSTTDPNAIIKMEYQLKLTVLLPGCHSNSTFRVPIVIGTIPIRESLPNTSEPANQPSAPACSAAGPDIDADLPPSYHDYKPPSFEEAIRSDSPFVDKEIDERHRMVGFRPLYPMYS